MNNFIVCVYATKDTPYVQIAESTILPSMKAIEGLKYSYSVVPNLGSWKKNTAYKATFAMEMLNKYPESNIVLLDADCKINNYPSLFDNIPEQYNIASHLLDWATWYQNGTTTKEFLTGTLFLRNCERTKYLVEKWIDGCEATNEWEQKVLAKVLVDYKEQILNLPLAYCYINSLPDGREPHVKIDNPTIIHYQSSRTLKRQIQ